MVTIATVCLHCQRKLRLGERATRGLCTQCYLQLDIRQCYPLLVRDPAQYAYRFADSYKEPRPTLEPTDTLPGTEGRIQVYRQRVIAGQQLYHKLDRREE